MLITLSEASAAIGLPLSTIERLAGDGGLTVVAVSEGSEVLLDSDEVEAFRRNRDLFQAALNEAISAD